MADQTDGFLSPWLRSQRMKAALPHIRGRVLDFGCGIGHLAGKIQPDDYLGYDADSWSVEKAKTLFPRHTFDSRLPDGQTFDTIVALAVLEHLGDPASVLIDFSRRLRPQGQIVLTTPHASCEWIHTVGAAVGLFSHHASDDHETLFDENQLRNLAKKTGLSNVLYRRFLGGANQLAVFAKS